jgi:alkylhydroperoxidase family enzyme
VSDAAGRLPLVAADTDDPALAKVFDVFRTRGREVPNLYRTLGNAPPMLQAWVDLAWPLRNQSTTSRGLRELIIMRVAQLTDARYEWIAHHDMAIESGNSAEAIAALKDWRNSDVFSDEERVLLALTDEITTDLEVSDATWADLAERWQPGELIELILTAAFYSCVSRTLRTLRMPVDVTDPRLADL